MVWRRGRGFVAVMLPVLLSGEPKIPLPPRTPDRAIPPAEMLQDMGFNVSSMVYHYSGHVVNWGVAGVHHLFSIFFALFYCALA